VNDEDYIIKKKAKTERLLIFESITFFVLLIMTILLEISLNLPEFSILFLGLKIIFGLFLGASLITLGLLKRRFSKNNLTV
jgi:hypothetical protein